MYMGVSRGAQVTGIAVMALSLTWISFVLRFYVRIKLLKFVGREDWLMVASMILLTLLCALCLVAISFGLGAHMYNIPNSSKETGFKYIFICELLYTTCTAVTKLSIGVYFLRLSSKRYQIWTIYTTLAVVMVISTMYFFFLLLQCSPINFLWVQWDGGVGKCLHGDILANVTYAHAAMSAVTDWAFGILPVFFVWKMQMNPRTKLSVILVLSLGFFASSATIVRIVYIRSLTLTDDWSWEGINLVKWSMVEPAIAITASNIATLRPLFRNKFVISQKRFTTFKEEDGLSTGSSYGLKSPSSVGFSDYSAEFADMLGLTRGGVTTEISAGCKKQQGEQSRKRFNLSRRASAPEHENESQVELHGVPPMSSHEDIDWSQGIKTTTTVIIHQ